MSSESKASGRSGYQMSRREFLKVGAAAGVATIAGSALAACAPVTQIAPEKILTFGLGGDPSSLNANVGSLSTAVPIYDALNDTLVGVNATTADLAPRLATSWSVSDDKLTWTFNLRKGVKFHNGEEMDAEAVKLSFDKGAEGKAVANTRIGEATLEIVDSHTVTITTKVPYVLLPTVMAELSIFPPKYYAEVGDDGMAAKPVGCGMYKFVSQETGGPVTLEKFDDYWGKEIGEAPALDKLIFKAYPEDATRVAALEAKEIDLCINLPPDDGARFSSMEGFGVEWCPLANVFTLNLLTRADERLQDVRVRQALNYAVNKQALVDNIMLGYAEPVGQIVGADAFGYNPSVEPYPYDPEKAKQLLAEAGYPDGFSIKYQSAGGAALKRAEMSEALVGELAKVGVNAELELLEFGTFINMLLFEKTSAPLAFVGWNYFPSLDADFTLQHFMCSSPFELFCDEELTKLYEQQRSEFDREKRKALLQECNAKLHELAPVVFLYQNAQMYGMTSRVKGFRALPNLGVEWSGVSVEG